MRAELAVLVVLLVVGCGPRANLGPEWLPLKHLVVSDTMAPEPGGALTLGETVYVGSRWHQHHPEPLRTASLLHEQAHAVRQLSYERGLAAWVARYAMDREFMWLEEQIGWFKEITYLRDHGIAIWPEGITEALAGYRNVLGPMVSREDAKRWVDAVVRREWRPPGE